MPGGALGRFANKEGALASLVKGGARYSASIVRWYTKTLVRVAASPWRLGYWLLVLLPASTLSRLLSKTAANKELTVVNEALVKENDKIQQELHKTQRLLTRTRSKHREAQEARDRQAARAEALESLRKEEQGAPAMYPAEGLAHLPLAWLVHAVFWLTLALYLQLRQSKALHPVERKIIACVSAPLLYLYLAFAGKRGGPATAQRIRKAMCILCICSSCIGLLVSNHVEDMARPAVPAPGR